MGARIFALAMVTALALTPSVAGASTSYPGLIEQDLGATCPSAPACTICHHDLNGGVGTVVTPFGRAMVGLGLVAESPASLKSALDQEKAAHADSDGDGDTDIDALDACRDPNQAFLGDGGSSGDGAPASRAEQAFADPTPEYGCAMGRARKEKGAAWLVVTGALLTGTLRRRRPRAFRR